MNGYKKFVKDINVDNRKKYTEVIPMTINLEPLFTTPPPKANDKTKGGKTDPKAKDKEGKGTPAKKGDAAPKKASPTAKPK